MMSPAVSPQTRVRHERLMDEARRIVDAGRERAVTLRLTGGLAVRRYVVDLSFAEREYSDIDFVGLARETGELLALFRDLGYDENLKVAQATGTHQRQFVRRPRTPAANIHTADRPRVLRPIVMTPSADEHVDVFLDAMRMDHELDMRDRLDLDEYAISPADIALSKLQIFHLDEKDVHDVVSLFKDVHLATRDRPQTINLTHIVETCAADWGLFIDVMANIDLCLDDLLLYALGGNDYHRVERGLVQLQDLMSDATKTLRWRLRATLGRRMAWRQEVDGTGRGPVSDT